MNNLNHTKCLAQVSNLVNVCALSIQRIVDLPIEARPQVNAMPQIQARDVIVIKEDWLLFEDLQ